MIKVFGWGIDEDQARTLDKIIKFLTVDIPDKQYETTDLRSFNPDIKKDDTVLIFGERARRLTSPQQSKFRLELPELYRLDTTLDENKQDIQDTVKKLSQLKQALSSVTNNDLPTTETVKETDKALNLNEEFPEELTTKVIEILEKQQRDQGINYWLGNTVDGRSIKITLEPEEGTADINLTFSELYAVMSLKEAFRVKELEIVYKSPHVTK